jgi:hypothetical protein
MAFGDDIPVRSNGERILASWFNLLRTAIIGLAGAGSLTESDFTFANNQAAAADVTGLLFDSSDSISAEVDIQVIRSGASGSARSLIKLYLMYYNSTWNLLDQTEIGEESGLTFSVTAAGQVQYTSDDLGGSYSGAGRFRATTFSV